MATRWYAIVALALGLLIGVPWVVDRGLDRWALLPLGPFVLAPAAMLAGKTLERRGSPPRVDLYAAGGGLFLVSVGPGVLALSLTQVVRGSRAIEVMVGIVTGSALSLMMLLATGVAILERVTRRPLDSGGSAK